MKKSIYFLSLFFAGMILIGQQAFAQNPEPEVTVIQPDKKNIEWVIGETYLISWTDNFVNTVDIYLVDYSTNPAGNYILIDEEIEGSTYEWFIDPNDFNPGENYKVRVQSSVNPAYNDDSRWEFSLVTSASNAFIKIEQPNVNNISWVKGNEYLISWTDNIEDPLDIYLVIDATYNADPTDDTHWIEIETAVEGSTFTWDIWDTLALRNDYRVLVTDENREEKDLSDKTFSIVESGGTITVLQPNVKNIEWIYGNEYLISWNRTTTGTFDLYLIKDFSDWYGTGTNDPFDEDELIEIETDVEGTTYSWEIDDNEIEGLVPGSEFRIMVRAKDSDIYDISNKDFSIVNYSGFIHVEQPNVRNISWILGTDHLISWLDNIDSDMNIYLVNDEEYNETDPNTWDLIEADVPGTTYTWEIDPNLDPRDDYRVLITTPDHSIKDLSDKTFSLVENDGEIDVIQPDIRGIKWVIGNEYLISWTSSAMGTVDIDLYSDAGSEIAEDDASNYGTATTFDTGDNEGTGFDDWVVTKNGTGTQEAIIGVPTGITGLDDPSFGIIGYDHATSSISAKRPFDEPLKVLDVFSLKWGVMWNYGPQGFKLYSGNDVIIDIYLTNASDDIMISYNGTEQVMFTNSGSNAMNISFEMLNPTKLKVTGIGRDNIEEFSKTYNNISGAPDAVEFYNIGQVNNIPQRISWFNDLRIISKYVDNIVEDVENSTYTWEIDDNIAPREDYRVKISAHDGGEFIYDFSRKPFEIALSSGGDLDFNQPSAGDVWYKGVAYWIIWEDDIMEPLDIYLKNAANTVNKTIATDFEGSMIDYLVPTNNSVPTGTDYYIQIVSTLDPLMVFNSGEFTIAEEVMAAIFPNPASQYFNVQFDEQMDGTFDVTIFDRFNNRMLETRLDAATKQHRISTATLPEGFYFVQMVSGDKTITKKIVVKH